MTLTNSYFVGSPSQATVTARKAQSDPYFGTGTPCKIGKISADGSTVLNTN